MPGLNRPCLSSLTMCGASTGFSFFNVPWNSLGVARSDTYKVGGNRLICGLRNPVAATQAPVTSTGSPVVDGPAMQAKSGKRGLL